MAENYLPSGENITILGGELYFQPDGAPRARSMGHVDAFSWTPSIETEPVYAATSGVRKMVKEITREISVAISMTLKEATAANMAAALQGTVSNLVQAAQTAANKVETDLTPGELIELGALNVSNVVVTDGAATPVALVAGTDYLVNAEAGSILVLTAQAKMDVTFDAPEIVDADGKKVIEVLSNQEGVSGVFTVIGKNTQGKRYKLVGVRANLKPSGDVALLSDGSGVLSIELEGSGVENPANPGKAWGQLISLN
jgi:hypothetical protein